jgi:hypothetical protein
MNVLEWQAASIENSNQVVAFWVGTTEPDKLNWKPKATEASETRSILEFVAELVGVNVWLAALFSGTEPPARQETEGEPFGGDGAAAQAALIESGKALASVVRSLDESVLEKTFETPMGQTPATMLLGMASGHTMYHGGQINYIQTLYGDTKFRFPGMD